MRNARSSISRALFRAIPVALLGAAGAVAATSGFAQEMPSQIAITEAQSSIEVVVLDEKTREPIPLASLLLVQSGKSFVATQAGTLELDLPIGTHHLRVSHVSYDPVEVDVTPIQGVKTSRTILMTPRLLVLPVLEVSAPSPGPKPANIGVQTLRTESLSSLPNLRDDPFQMLRVLPGVTTDDVGADFHMRGGGQHETLVRIDGMEVRQLFHGRDFGGITSIIPFGVVEKMDVYSGAFPAQYGGKLSGVVDIGLRSDEREGVEDPWTKDSG
ncbi:MAG TPA: TonB-dependent receptor plug domain-containing protein, partial [bacterium]|nr:TonB-dependent receptor plug domain-containing protein [bacterium]